MKKNILFVIRGVSEGEAERIAEGLRFQIANNQFPLFATSMSSDLWIDVVELPVMEQRGETLYPGLANLRQIATEWEKLESLDVITGQSPDDRLIPFLVKATRAIVYRLGQFVLWDRRDYDARLYIPERVKTAFINDWEDYCLNTKNTVYVAGKKLLGEEHFIGIDDVKIRLIPSKAFASYYLIFSRVGDKTLVDIDENDKVRSIRAPWATARYDLYSDLTESKE